ncbi:hypothetical protein ABE021_13630 [Sporosarcina gallistercoris]|uniref:hypothetical protein n=1 Tax=Sporosarcina gallistercoris TaxID=2762245 RepID=UPI003D28D419
MGTYGPGTSTTLNGNLYVNSNATLQNLTVNGTVYVNPGDDGTVTLNNVTATNIVVLSGATNSIHLNNVTADSLTVKNDDSVRIESNPGTAITSTIVQSGATLDAKGGSFGTIELVPATSAAIELRGDFSGSSITVPSNATVGQLVVASDANAVTVNNQGAISEVKADAAVNITGNAPANKDEFDAEQGLITFLNTAKGYNYTVDTPAKGNYKAIADLEVAGNTVTMNINASTDVAAIEAIGAKSGMQAKADAAGKKLDAYATDLYAMNTLARYLGSLYRLDTGVTIETIIYNDKEYTWNTSGTNIASNWENNGKTLVSEVVDNSVNRSVRNVDFKIVNADDIQVPVSYKTVLQ